MQKKLKVLVLSDHALSTSGVGTQTRHLLEGLIKKKCWTFRQFGAALKHSDYRTVVVNDDLIIKPSETYIPKNNKIRTDFDHRIAMSFAVMGSKVGNLIIDNAESINTSFPNFIEKFNKAGGNIL